MGEIKTLIIALTMRDSHCMQKNSGFAVTEANERSKLKLSGDGG